MDLNKRPPWSKNALRRLGQVLKTGEPVNGNHPTYDEVMEWHGDLVAEISRIIASNEWQHFGDEVAVSARAKTVDTLVQKLQRESTLKLDKVGDIAGVRIDGPFDLETQLAAANEIAAYFGDAAFVKDLRDGQHSGYRAVHVRLEVPAGNVEIQIRTTLQSAWANSFERVADRFGRDIRYGGQANSEEGRQLVEQLLTLSKNIAQLEATEAPLSKLRSEIDRLAESGDPERFEPISNTVVEIQRKVDELKETGTRLFEKLIIDLEASEE